MILADTSIWIDHLRSPDARLAGLLINNQLLMHPFVTGELAMGNMHERAALLTELQNLLQADVVPCKEVLNFIGAYALAGSGMGYIDAHLLSAVHRSQGVTLWTRDKRLNSAASGLGLNASF